MYNFYMPNPEGKKVVTVTVKVSSDNREQFEKICKEQDRSMSYVVRELALRGLSLYKSDGILKFSEDDELIATSESKNNKDNRSLKSSALDSLEANPKFQKTKGLGKATERMYKNAGDPIAIEDLNKKK